MTARSLTQRRIECVSDTQRRIECGSDVPIGLYSTCTGHIIINHGNNNRKGKFKNKTKTSKKMIQALSYTSMKVVTTSQQFFFSQCPQKFVTNY